MESADSNQPHILIIGAGVCGLALAHGLAKASIPFTIFEAESATAFRPREWTMSLHWSLPMLESLLPDDLAMRIRKDAVVDPSLDYAEYPHNVIPIFDGINGEVVREISAEGGVRVSRRKLRKLCAEGIDVQYGHALKGIDFDDADGSVTANFSNGVSRKGNLIVGTDGSRSAVRAQMFPSHAQPTALDIAYVNFAFKYPDADKAIFARSAHPVTSIMLHPDSCAMVSVQDIQQPAKPETWLFSLTMAWTGARIDREATQAEKRAEVMRKASNLQEPFRSAFLQMPEDVETSYNQLGYWVPPTSPPWDTRGGRATLAGDAAHSMPPHRGQGLNNALNDAFNLCQAIRKMNAANQAETIDAYSSEVAERGSKEVNLSRETANLLMDFSKFRESALMQHGLRKA